MVQCSNCGAWIADDQQFCPQCGAPRPSVNAYDSLKGKPTDPPPQPQPTATHPPQGATPKNIEQPKVYYSEPTAPGDGSGKRGCVIWGAVGCFVMLFVLACALVAGYIFYTQFYSGQSQVISTAIPTQLVPTLPIEQPTVVPPTAEQPTQPPAVTNTPSLPVAEHKGVSFRYDNTIAASVQGADVPEDNNPGNPFWSTPAHIEFSFQGYALPQTFHEPKIYIYPVDAYIAINPDAAGVIAELQALLAAKPPSPDAIPFLPLFNAAQIMRAKIKYFDFASGSGVRFLTEYAQNYAVINNFELFYTYQGLTADGKYYISAVLPISHPSLPANGDDIPGGDYDEFIKNYDQYLIDTVNALNGQPPNSYNPAIGKLDKMIKSLTVATP